MGWKRKTGNDDVDDDSDSDGMREMERKGGGEEGGREEEEGEGGEEGEGRCCMLNVTVRDTARCLSRYTTLHYTILRGLLE